ncbi:hypothetical protein BDZ97DRAFT_1928699 [Flammula alnicola]|nr:hypothetical protein BDZ97DRAFT_1928699 [Flammula alnicola]
MTKRRASSPIGPPARKSSDDSYKDDVDPDRSGPPTTRSKGKARMHQKAPVEESRDEGMPPEKSFGEQVKDAVALKKFDRLRLVAFSSGAHRVFENARSEWKDTVPSLKEMPGGWPGKGLKAGLRPEHIYPKFYEVQPVPGRNKEGELLEKAPGSHSTTAHGEEEQEETMTEGNHAEDDDSHMWDTPPATPPAMPPATSPETPKKGPQPDQSPTHPMDWSPMDNGEYESCRDMDVNPVSPLGPSSRENDITTPAPPLEYPSPILQGTGKKSKVARAEENRPFHRTREGNGPTKHRIKLMKLMKQPVRSERVERIVSPTKVRALKSRRAIAGGESGYEAGATSSSEAQRSQSSSQSSLTICVPEMKGEAFFKQFIQVLSYFKTPGNLANVQSAVESLATYKNIPNKTCLSELGNSSEELLIASHVLMARTQIRLREPSGTSAVNRTGKKRAAAEDAAKKIKHQARKGRSRRQTQQRHSPGPDQCPPLSAVLKMPQFDALEVLKAGEDNEELAETLRANDCVFVVHEGIDLDASVIDPHEYWKMQIVSLHKDRATGKKWVVGAWFYTPSQLEGVKLTDKDRSIIKRMGNAELVLSTHKDVIDPLCIQSKLTVHFFDDNDALTRPIKQSSWFHRFILTWRGSAQPTKDYGVLKPSSGRAAVLQNMCGMVPSYLHWDALPDQEDEWPT